MKKSILTGLVVILIAGCTSLRPKGRNMTSKEIRARFPNIKRSWIGDIKSERLDIGMTTEMVRLSWGNPRKINPTITKYGRSAQWIYGVYSAYLDTQPTYLYFKNGKLTTIQR